MPQLLIKKLMFGNKNGILGTFLFHGIVVIFVLLFGFSTPLPLPDEEGILVNFGTDEYGFGEVEPQFSEVFESPPPEDKDLSTPRDDEEETVTQDFEEAPGVEEQKETEQIIDTKTEEVKDTETEDNVEEVLPPEKEPQKVDERALYKGRKNTDNTTEGEGITEGEGNQGSITGSPDSDNYSSALSQGSGGVTFSLAGRNPVSLPKPEYKYQVEGTVVVRIRVNREGIVISAEAGVKGSNTTDKRLLDAAREAALKARFNTQQDAAFTQVGTITYRFILR